MIIGHLSDLTTWWKENSAFCTCISHVKARCAWQGSTEPVLAYCHATLIRMLHQKWKIRDKCETGQDVVLQSKRRQRISLLVWPYDSIPMSFSKVQSWVWKRVAWGSVGRRDRRELKPDTDKSWGWPSGGFYFFLTLWGIRQSEGQPEKPERWRLNEMEGDRSPFLSVEMTVRLL